MKKLFVEFQDYNAVAFVDDLTGKALILDETETNYEKPLTIDCAKTIDFSNIDMDNTADQAFCDQGFGTLIFWNGEADTIGADAVTEI
jgi:hypothetical protein